MYADHVESGKKRSIRDRLDGDVGGGFGRSRPASGKRQRQSDDKWKHDLYVDRGGPQISKARVDAEDLRLKLQKKTTQKTHHGGKESEVQDRSGKLAGNMPPALSKAKRVPEPPIPLIAKRVPEPLIAKRVPEPPAPPKVKRVPDPPAPVKAQLVSEIAKPVKKNIVSVEETVLDTKKVPASTSSRKKSQKKAGLSVDDLLKSLGLEKYSITFQVEEVDMSALRHMTEDDLKVLGIPMGPRKKILLALNTKAYITATFSSHFCVETGQLACSPFVPAE